MGIAKHTPLNYGLSMTVLGIVILFIDLILSAGCTCGGLENCGLMTMEAVELAGPGLKEVCIP